MGRAFISLLAGLSLTAHAETLTFGPLPMEAPEAVAVQFKPMLDYLQQEMGATFRIEHSASHGELIDKFRRGEVDVAYLGPLPYIALRDGYPAAEPVVQFIEASGSPTYTCAIVARADSGLTPAMLKGRRIALTQPLSTCGYLSTDGLLRRAGRNLEQNSYRYLDKHDEVALAVVRGEFAAGGLKASIGRRYGHLGLTVIAETAPLPGFALIANAKTMTAERIATLRRALLALQPVKNESDRNRLRSWGENVRHGAVAASDRDYAPVRQLRASTYIPDKGNF